MGILPTLKELKKGLRTRMLKENVIYKIVIDVFDHHFKTFEEKDFKVLIK